ncbi:hypothetical protein V5N11_013442 [Cardamine amara subsp. amara]|uniref:PAP/OAS1 substrate-binding-related domain-containing protein n=1 Tax=Cardamine amara subsp. amara TaxID=228776 RepID=A0ABD0ZAI7_CARAN
MESEFLATDVQFSPAQVDQLFRRDHLFKHSIILIKAWCYYESRILGANTGLILIYALAVNRNLESV